MKDNVAVVRLNSPDNKVQYSTVAVEHNRLCVLYTYSLDLLGTTGLKTCPSIV